MLLWPFHRNEIVIKEIRQRVQTELKALEHELIHELPKEIKRALALGDLRENAEYHSALERQSLVKARIGQLKRKLSDLASFNYDAIPKDKVGLGSIVNLVDLDTRCTDVYRLGADGLWVLHPFAGDDVVRLASVALDITAAQLFAEI